jgi:hypothetical protein
MLSPLSWVQMQEFGFCGVCFSAFSAFSIGKHFSAPLSSLLLQRWWAVLLRAGLADLSHPANE